MPTYNAEFIDGFDKYGPATVASQTSNTIVNTYFVGEWSQSTGAYVSTGTDFGCNIGPSLLGPGQSVWMTGKNSNGAGSNLTAIQHAMGGNYQRVIGGCFIKSDQLGTHGITFGDGSTDQLSIVITSGGALVLTEGTILAATLATASQALAANSTYVLEYDITFGTGTAGSYKIYLNGILTSLSATGVRTSWGTANAYVSQIRLAATGPFNTLTSCFYDHFYLWMYTVTGSADTPALTNAIVETSFPISDSSIQFTPGAAILGAAFSNTTTNTNAPGANKLVLRQYMNVATAPTLNSISLLPGATAGGANFKGVVYADNGLGTAPTGAPLSSGTQVTGCISGTTLVLPLVTPQALVVGTIYWIGFITDTSVAIFEQDNSITGYIATNTYASGAPTSPTMTSGQVSWSIWGNMTGMTSNWSQVQENPSQGDMDYNSANTTGTIDQYNFASLSSVPQNIYTVAIKSGMRKADAGARTVSLAMTSNGTQGTGSAPSQGVPVNYTYLASYFDTDPHTGVPWTYSGINAATAGPLIAT